MGADILAFAPTLSSSPQTSRGHALQRDKFGLQTDQGCAFCALQTHRFRVRQSLCRIHTDKDVRRAEDGATLLFTSNTEVATR